MADFGGRYRLDRCVGAGGMGEVWLAYDEELGDRPVAIKVMRSRMPADEAGLARFQREMRLASRMQHPNIMTVFTTGSDQGAPFMVVEYLQGRDLSKMPAGWSADEVAQIGRETCMALSYAHGLDPGVVHRDIKPGNLFVCDTGTVKVTDFGLAKAITETGLSTAGTVYGTMAYISPELWLGAPVTFSDDIWALGCVLYELLSGRLPRSYKSPTEYLAAAARREYVAPLPDIVPAGLAEAVMAMLHTDPRSRPTASQAVELLSVRRAQPVPATVTSPLSRATAWQSPAGREMPSRRRETELAWTQGPEAEASMPQGQPPPDRPFSSAGPIIPAQERPAISRPGMPAGTHRRTETATGPQKKRKLLISAVAGAGVLGALTYAAVSAFTGPTSNSSLSGEPGSRPAPAPGTGTAPVTNAPPPDPNNAKEIAYKMLPSFGFSQTTQYSCLIILWERISSWNVYAEGKSGAYGIPQAKPGDAMAASGPDWRTDAATQVKWGLSYIKETYGTPCGAWQYEESNGSY
jgi:serine/threonine protein kinase